MAVAQKAPVDERDMGILARSRTSGAPPGSTTAEPEFKIELYDRGSLRSAFIVRIRNLAGP